MTEGERSAQEREAARRERERMRAARRRGDDQDHERGDHEEDRDVDGEPDLYADHEADLDADDELDGYADHDGFADDELGRYADHELDADADADGYEVPAGTRRVARSERLQELDRAGERVRLSRRSPAPKRAPAKRHSYAGRVLALLALIAGVALIWFLVQLFQPLHGSGGASVTVTIPPRTSSSAIGDLLARDGVVSSGFFFKLRVALGGDRGKLLAGTYHLKRDMTYGAVLKLLTTPPPAAPVSELTITPGRTRRQVDALLAAQHIRGSYLVATRRSRLLNPSAYGAPRDTPSLEGFLFPDTFQLRDPVSITALVADQLRDFRRQFATVNLRAARGKRMTAYDVLIIASMIEAEAQVARDRPLIASVIYNRLALGMPLQIDATTRYATGNYSSPLTRAQLDSPSPYNTRIHKGLPPTAIDSPGLDSIQAAAHPANTSYLYFVVKPCGNGEHAFASNYKQFEREVNQYDSARAKRGGRSPAEC